MVNLVTLYNDTVEHDPVKMISDSTIFEMGLLAASLDSTNERLSEACESFFSSLRTRDMSEAVEHIGVALGATYDNARIMIDMFNRIMRESSYDLTGRQVCNNGE